MTAPVAIASPAGSAGLRGSEDVLGILLSAIDYRGRPCSFRTGRRAPSPTPCAPSSRGAWSPRKAAGISSGHDRDRDATRTFRLSRIGAEVDARSARPARSPMPDDVDLREIVAETVGETPTGVQAQVWVADGRATALRRAGRSVGPGSWPAATAT